MSDYTNILPARFDPNNVTPAQLLPTNIHANTYPVPVTDMAIKQGSMPGVPLDNPTFAAVTAMLDVSACIPVANATCARQGCRVNDSSLKECQAKTCKKLIHAACFDKLRMKYNLVGLGPGMVACTKGCYTKSVKELEKEQKEAEGLLTLPWEKDGKFGEDDPRNSMSVLVDWWVTHPNYEKYRGYRNKGTRKIEICNRLCEKINEVSRCVRTAHSVKAKIAYIEQSWRRAHDWANETGQGVKENEGIDSLRRDV